MFNRENKLLTTLALFTTYVVVILREKWVYLLYYTPPFLNIFHPIFKNTLFSSYCNIPQPSSHFWELLYWQLKLPFCL